MSNNGALPSPESGSSHLLCLSHPNLLLLLLNEREPQCSHGAPERIWDQWSSSPQGTHPNILHHSLWSTHIIVTGCSLKDPINQNGLAITGQQSGHHKRVDLQFISYVVLNEDSLYHDSIMSSRCAINIYYSREDIGSLQQACINTGVASFLSDLDLQLYILGTPVLVDCEVSGTRLLWFRYDVHMSTKIQQNDPQYIFYIFIYFNQVCGTLF